MALSAEDKVENYQRKQARRDAGLNPWAYKVDLTDVFHDTKMSFEQKRDAIVARLRASAWIRECGSDGGPLDRTLEDLAEAFDATEFDDVWDEIYDRATFDHAWIEA